eukprot:SAG22_NODE_20377_length_266_cov_0.622754_1_plen_41_part_10
MTRQRARELQQQEEQQLPELRVKPTQKPPAFVLDLHRQEEQ